MDNKEKTMAVVVQEKYGIITNANLRKNLQDMESALIAGNKASWKFALAMEEIVRKESYKEDFGNRSKFAEKVGVSNSAMSQYVKAVEFTKKEKISILDITVSKSYILASSLNHEQYLQFKENMENLKVDFLKITDKDLKTYINEFKETLEEKVNIDNTEEVENLEETVSEEMEENTTPVTDRILVKDSNGNRYLIPKDILEEYKVE